MEHNSHVSPCSTEVEVEGTAGASKQVDLSVTLTISSSDTPLLRTPSRASPPHRQTGPPGERHH